MSLSYREATLAVFGASHTTGAGSYDVTAYPVGAIASAGSSGTTITVDAGHSFRAGDKYLLGPGGANTFSGTDTVQSVTATTVVMGQSVTVSSGDALVNMGPDTGTSAPNYDASPVAIYSDADGSTAVSNSRVTCDGTTGEFSYYHKGDGRFWELVRNSAAAVVDVVKGFGGVQGRHNVADYGAAVDNSTDDVLRVQAANDAAAVDGESVWFPGGTCLIDKTVGISCSSGVTYTGPGVVKFSSGTVTADLFLVSAKTDVAFDGLELQGANSSAQYGMITISGASARISVRGCKFDDGYSGVWVKQGSDIRIHDCDLNDAGHSIYLGDHTTPTEGGAVRDVVISHCHIHDSASNDGIKTVQDVERLVIDSCSIYNNAADGIDLYVSGDKVTISNCIIRNNSIQGIDAKWSSDAIQTTEGHASRQFIVDGCQIHDNSLNGISITNNVDTEWGSYISITNNLIYSNTLRAIISDAHYITIANNQIYENCQDTGTDYNAIEMQGNATEAVSNVLISGNMICNNGHSTKSNAGVNLNSCANVVVVHNVFSNDANLDNPNQDIGLRIINAAQSGAIYVGMNVFDSSLTTAITDASDWSVPFQNAGLTMDAGRLLEPVSLGGRNYLTLDSAGTGVSLDLFKKDGSKVQEWNIQQQMSTTSWFWVGKDSGGSTVNTAFIYAVTTGKITVDDFIVGTQMVVPTTAGITADVGSSQGDGALTAEVNEISTCANIGDAVTLPAAEAGLKCTVLNNGANSADVFPASGDNCGAGANTAVALAAGDMVTFYAYDTTNWRGVKGTISTS